MKIRQFLLCVVLCVAGLVTGCGRGGGGTDRYFAYRDRDLRAEVRGTLYGVEFTAEIGQTYADGSAYIRYMTPASLEGICLTRQANGQVSLALNGMRVATDDELTAGLLLPLQLLLHTERTVQAIQKRDGYTTLTLSDEVKLVLSEKGIPTQVASPHARVHVAWWECG